MMANQSRVAKVLGSLLISMTLAAVVLMLLGNNPPAAGPFCLSAYYKLDPVQKAVKSLSAQTSNRWNRIEVFYSGTKAGNIAQLAAFYGLNSPEQLNCHFCITNGRGQANGKISPTQKWNNQWSCVKNNTWYGSERTIRICLVSDGKTIFPTDYQMKRLDQLVECLYRKFDILPENIYYPGDWK